jgi:hypothetical protein
MSHLVTDSAERKPVESHSLTRNLNGRASKPAVPIKSEVHNSSSLAWKLTFGNPKSVDLTIQSWPIPHGYTVPRSRWQRHEI